jgi:hypothetical protein
MEALVLAGKKSRFQKSHYRHVNNFTWFRAGIEQNNNNQPLLNKNERVPSYQV